jgi:hypothetical protein
VAVSRAYIAGIGTTGVLVGFALLMLAVVSAIVAFRGWPGDAVIDGAGAVKVGDDARLIDIDPLRLGAGASPAAGGGAARAATGRTSGGRTAGGRFDVRGVTRSGTAGLTPGSVPGGPPDSTSTPSLPANRQEGGVTGGLAGDAEQAAGAVGEVAAPVTGGVPEAGGLTETLGGAGGAVQQKAGELRLP